MIWILIVAGAITCAVIASYNTEHCPECDEQLNFEQHTTNPIYGHCDSCDYCSYPHCKAE